VCPRLKSPLQKSDGRRGLQSNSEEGTRTSLVGFEGLLAMATRLVAGHVLVLGGNLEKRTQMEKKRVWRKYEKCSEIEVNLLTNTPGLWIHLRKTESVNGHNDSNFRRSHLPFRY